MTTTSSESVERNTANSTTPAPSVSTDAGTNLSDLQRILDAAIAILSQGEQLLKSLEPGKYCHQVAVAFNASIGGHYRHCLDHFISFTRALEGKELNYDHRDRDPRIEQDAEFALTETRRLRAVLENLLPSALAARVRAVCEVSYAVGDSPVTSSSLGRELVYCIAHAIHHYALIAVMARLMDANLPPHFGIAPSTVAHLAATSGR